ncbi:MAG: DUF4266 domain-containing protein [Polyangiales bacterium]
MFAERVRRARRALRDPPATAPSDGRLRVYTTGLLERDPSRAHRDEPIDAAELNGASRRSAAAFALGVSSAAENPPGDQALNVVNHLGARCSRSDAERRSSFLAWLRSELAVRRAVTSNSSRSSRRAARPRSTVARSAGASWRDCMELDAPSGTASFDAHVRAVRSGDVSAGGAGGGGCGCN